MIAVSVQGDEREAAREFFELCKVPWTFYQPGDSAEVIVATSDLPASATAKLLIRYRPAADAGKPAVDGAAPAATWAAFAGERLPLYSGAQTFPASPSGSLLVEDPSGQSLVEARRQDGTTVVQLGYALFAEVSRLLTAGQPAANAGIPALDLHISLLREVITRAGHPLVEIPPVPAGSAFLACLTHDIDHPLFRNHVADHTAAGFLARATLGSALDLARGRLPPRRFAENWWAALRSPFVHAGLARDYWRNFDRYLELEGGRPSTVYVIPERGRPGRRADGAAPAKRACRYDLAEIAPDLQRVAAAGGEIGVHGIDAWIDAQSGRAERAAVCQVMGEREMGIRMHWLYFSPEAPALLEQAGYAYDSTVGYNETIGFRAGTTQAFRPLTTSRLLELPLHIMDTSLFYPDHLHLTEPAAAALVANVLDHFGRHGGVVTVNWHDRSIAPERLWGEFYQHLIAELQRRGAWFGTAGQAAAWFRQRRQATFHSVRRDGDHLAVRADVPALDSRLPALRIRVHKPHASVPPGSLATGPAVGFVDAQLIPFTETNLKL